MFFHNYDPIIFGTSNGFFLHLVYILNVLEFTNYYDKQEGLMWIYEINKGDFIYVMNKTQLNAFLLMVFKLS